MNEDLEIELESVEAIYGDAYQKVDNDGDKIKFRVEVSSTPSDEEDAVPAVLIAITFTISPDYPKSIPSLHFRVVRGLNLNQCKQIEEAMKHEAQEYIEDQMLFPMITKAKELCDACVSGDDLPTFDIDPNREADLIENEPKDYSATKFDGTRVTPENFIEWQTKFEQELLENPNVIYNATLDSRRDKSVLTGRDHFLLKNAESILEYVTQDDDDDNDNDNNDNNNNDNNEDDENDSELAQKTETIAIDASVFAKASLEEEDLDFSDDE